MIHEFATTPKEIAVRERVKPKKVRDILREQFPELKPGSGNRWILTQDMENRILSCLNSSNG